MLSQAYGSFLQSQHILLQALQVLFATNIHHSEEFEHHMFWGRAIHQHVYRMLQRSATEVRRKYQHYVRFFSRADAIVFLAIKKRVFSRHLLGHSSLEGKEREKNVGLHTWMTRALYFQKNINEWDTLLQQTIANTTEKYAMQFPENVSRPLGVLRALKMLIRSWRIWIRPLVQHQLSFQPAAES